MIAYRIADARHPIFDPTGAMLHGGRWNSVGARVIMLRRRMLVPCSKILAHSNLSQPPKNHRVVRIELPAGAKIEPVGQEQVPGWDAEDAGASRTYGDEWIRARRTAVLQVPSVITLGRVYNLVLNTEHPDFEMIQAGAPEIVP